jgi:hypothetical protein
MSGLPGELCGVTMPTVRIVGIGSNHIMSRIRAEFNNKPKAEVQPGHLLTGPKEEEYGLMDGGGRHCGQLCWSRFFQSTGRPAL